MVTGRVMGRILEVSYVSPHDNAEGVLDTGLCYTVADV